MWAAPLWSRRVDGDMALVSVRHGIGLHRGRSPHLDTFPRADRSLDRSRGGLGLRLAQSRGWSRLHEGTIDASSAGPGLGSEFNIRLPLQANPETKPLEQEVAQTEFQAFRILVIEDNRDAAESTRMLLSLIGHEVQTAHTGEAGLALARTFHPNVILCDIGLPGGMNGYDVAKRIRQEPELKSAHIIALTGYGRDEDHQQTQAAGFDLHLIKPVEFSNLRRTLATLSPRKHELGN